MLAELGYYSGPLDGRKGSKTVRALETFREEHDTLPEELGIYPDTKKYLDLALARLLPKRPPPPASKRSPSSSEPGETAVVPEPALEDPIESELPKPAPEPHEPTKVPEPGEQEPPTFIEVMQVQGLLCDLQERGRLDELGFDSCPPDGEMDNETCVALEWFKKNNGLSKNCQIDEETIETLRRELSQ